MEISFTSLGFKNWMAAIASDQGYMWAVLSCGDHQWLLLISQINQVIAKQREALPSISSLHECQILPD